MSKKTDDKDNVQTYYHHTDRNSAGKILMSGVIKQSTDTVTDAVCGEGAYLTTLGPDCSRDEIAKNNYDGNPNYYESKIKDGKTDVVFEVSVPANKVTAHTDNLGRDVHTHTGDIPLNNDTLAAIHFRKTGSNNYISAPMNWKK